MARDTLAGERLTYLIGRIAMRDRVAFKEMYDLTSRFLFRVAIRKLSNAVQAEDVLQEAFMEVWQKAAAYSASISKPMTWLMTIVNRRAIDEHRRMVAEGKVIQPIDSDDADIEGWDFGEVFSDTFRDLFGSAVMERLGRCFEILSADQRRAIKDIRILGMTYDEAALFYKQPRQTVASWVRRGIESLMGCMQS